MSNITQWQPIASKPTKSGFYLLHSSGKVSVGRYQVKKDKWMLPPGWFGSYAPTEWMPLPEAPQ